MSKTAVHRTPMVGERGGAVLYGVANQIVSVVLFGDLFIYFVSIHKELE